jgi:hypothetical protein
MYRSTVPFLFFLHCAFSVAHVDVFPAYVLPALGREWEKRYAVEIYAGDPWKRVLAETAFDRSTIDLWYTPDSIAFDGSTEQILLGSHKARFYVDAPAAPFDSTPCVACEGALGLYQGSPFWRAYSEMSLFPTSVVAGGRHHLFSGVGGCNRVRVPCDDYRPDTLCTFSAKLGTTPISVELRPDLAYTQIPTQLYDNYFDGKNVYDPSAWTDALEIVIPNDQDASEKGGCTRPFSIKLTYADLVYTSDAGTKTLLARSYNTSENVVVLGASVWGAVAFHRRSVENDLMIRTHKTYAALGWGDCVLVLVLLVLTMRWMLSDVSRLATDSTMWHSEVLDYVYEIVAIPLAVYAIANAGTREALEDYPVLRVASFVSSAIALAAEIGSILLAHTLSERQLRKASVGYCVTTVRSFSHVVLLLHGTWCALLARRFEGVDTALTFTVNTVAIMVFAFYFFVSLVFFLSEVLSPRSGDDNASTALGCATLLLLGVLWYQGFAWWNYFASPLFKRNARFYEAILVPGMLMGTGVLCLFASYLTRKTIRKATLSVIAQRFAKKPLPQPSAMEILSAMFSADKRK